MQAENLPLSGRSFTARVSEQEWVETVKQHTQESLEEAISDLLQIRSRDPYRELNPLAWRAATQPPVEG